MRLETWNVALFEQNNEALAKFLNEQHPDIICLQEVTRQIDPATIKDYLSKSSIDAATPELLYGFYGPLWLFNHFEVADFHQQEQFSVEFGGFLEFGNYIRSRFPIAEAKNVFLQEVFSYITEWSQWKQRDPRAVQIVDLLIGQDKPMRILNYHGIWTKDKQGNDKTLAACQRIMTHAKEVSVPTIIVGDFNLFPDTASIQLLSREFRNLCDEFNVRSTRPASNELSHKERNVVDYIFVSPEIKVNSFEVIETTISDHFPLVLDFEL